MTKRKYEPSIRLYEFLLIVNVSKVWATKKYGSKSKDKFTIVQEFLMGKFFNLASDALQACCDYIHRCPFLGLSKDHSSVDHHAQNGPKHGLSDQCTI